MTASLAEQLRDLDEATLERVLAEVADEDREALAREWRFVARPEQQTPPGDWRFWALLAGKGSGKTRSGAEWVVDRCEAFAEAGEPHSVGLINRTFTEVRQLQIDGISGLRRVCERRGHRFHHPTTANVAELWVGDHKSEIELRTAEEPEGLRGRNWHTVWADELAAWPAKTDDLGNTAWTNADFSLRGKCPEPMRAQAVVTTTPKATRVIKDLAAGNMGPTVLSRMTTFDNRRNLDEATVAALAARYGGTRLGDQELYGMLLSDIEGALWTSGGIDATRVWADEVPADLVRVVVGVDPGATAGVVVAGAAWLDGVMHFYVLEDVSLEPGIGRWADEYPQRAVAALRRHGADAIVAERNYGGDQVRTAIALADPSVPVKMVTATRGKIVRAEPVSTMWPGSEEQATQAGHPFRGHVVGHMVELEEQLTSYVPGDPSPDRLDACVWCAYELLPELLTMEATRAYGSTVAGARL